MVGIRIFFNYKYQILHTFPFTISKHLQIYYNSTMSSVIASLENNSIYMILSLRGAEPGFHWGIFVPTDKPEGEVWHATNRSGGWSLENRTTSGVPDSMSLCLCCKVGSIANQNLSIFNDILRSVSANGNPSPNTQETFSCRVWVKDALSALDNAGLISLRMDTSAIERDAIKEAEANRRTVERSTDGALVWNENGFFNTY